VATLSGDPVLVSRTPPALVVALNRPERRNALNPELMAALRHALDDAREDPAVRAVVLTGTGVAFCAGMDIEALRRVQEASAEEQLRDAAAFRDLCLAVYRFPKPVIAAVNGAAFGGGAGLALACDVAVAAPEAVFATTEVRIGFVPAVIAPFVVRAVGERVARDLLLTGRRVSAEEALRLRLVAEVVPAAAELLPRARAWAELCAAGAPESLALTKELLAVGIEAALAAAPLANAWIRRTAGMREGLDAFLGKRLPAWHPERGRGEPGGTER
jgi:methylglutaconyl-CoA hydratase